MADEEWPNWQAEQHTHGKFRTIFTNSIIGKLLIDEEQIVQRQSRQNTMNSGNEYVEDIDHVAPISSIFSSLEGVNIQYLGIWDIDLGHRCCEGSPLGDWMKKGLPVQSC
jgi:hypothetical protein